MRTNPFDDEDGLFYVLVNGEGRYSLWPVFAGVPDGWQVAHGETDRASALEYIDGTWKDMRPASIRQTASPGPAGD